MSEDGTSQDDVSELLDGDVLGEEPGDDTRPGVGGYPPDHPLGAEDPTLYDEDDLETRATLRRDLGADDDDDGVSLVDTAPEGALDHEPELLADTADAVGDATLPAEEAAIHLTDGDPVD